MVYDWDDKRDLCWRMYVDEKKTTKQIMEFFKDEMGFVPRYVEIPLTSLNSILCLRRKQSYVLCGISVQVDNGRFGRP